LIHLLLLLLIAPAHAAPAVPEDAPTDAVQEALDAELARAWEQLQTLDPPPYHVALEVVESESVTVVGEEGGLQGYSPNRSRWVHADIRIGSPGLDSNHPLRDLSLDDSQPPGREMGLGDDPAVLRLEIAREIDARYRDARDRWQRVLSDRQVLIEQATPGTDLAPSDGAAALLPTARLGDLDLPAWEAAVQQASAVFADHQTLQDPNVSISADAITRWIVTTDGHRVREGNRLFRAAVSADTLTTDGDPLTLYEAFDAASPEGLPSADELTAAASALVDRLTLLANAPLEEPFRGPAILGGRAAAVFFHEIFGHRVEGHRLRQVDDAQTFLRQVGQPILPTWLSVYDDPGVKEVGGVDLRGHYQYDDEGEPGQRADLVTDGVLKGFLESRQAVHDERSNGHGRRQAGNFLVTRQGNLIVEAANSVSEDELRAQLVALAKEQGLPYGLAIDDIEGGFTFTGRDIPNAFQIDAVQARRVFVDGRPDEVVRGIDLIGTPLQTFSKIVAAGPTPEVFNGTCGAESGWVPVSASAPALLIEQVESQRKLGGQLRAPLLPPPGNATPPSAAPGSDALLDVLVAQAGRVKEQLRLPGAEDPSRVVVAVRDQDVWQVSADFGELRNASGRRTRPARVEVVVGDDELNSSRVQGTLATVPDALQRPRLVVRGPAVAIARDLWISADAAYKAALQRIAFKRAARTRLAAEAPPDWTASPVVVHLAPGDEPTADRARLERLARAGSAALRGVDGLLRGTALAREDQGRDYLVDTDGTRLVQRNGYAVLYLFADLLRPDGVRLFDRRQWIARSAAELPSEAEVVAAAQQLGAAISARAEATAVGWYEGPVVFEDEAAADLLRYLLPGELRGTPPVPNDEESYAKQTRRGPRLLRRVLPNGWSVTDDPSSQPGLPGGFAYDAEGVAAEPVSLVDDGRVVDLLMTRVPRDDRRVSNGHARGSVGGEWTARLTHWSATPKKMLRDAAFDRQVVAARRAEGLPAVLVVTRLEQGWEGGLPMPSEAVWRFADGREMPVLSLEFTGIDRRTLRGLVAAGGGLQTRAYLAATRGYGRAPSTAGLPMSITAPRRLLLEEIEAVFPGPTQQPPVYEQASLQD